MERRFYYRKVRIPKRKGEYKEIFVPSPELRNYQRIFLKRLKNSFQEAVPYYLNINGLNYGSYVDHAKIHANSRWVFQFSIENAFL